MLRTPGLDGTYPVCLLFPVVQTLATKRPLIDEAGFSPAERHAVLFQFADGPRRLAAHVMDGVLIPEPVGALDRVVHVPPPVVLGHVSQRGVDATLGRDGVRAGGKQLCHDGGVEPGFREPDRGTQAGSSSAHDDCVILMVDHLEVPECAPGGGCRGLPPLLM